MTNRRERESAPEQAPAFKGALLPWLFLLPSLLILAVFSYYPALQTFRLAAFRSNVILGSEQFVGFGNFVDLLSSSVYRQVAFQTLVFAVLTVVIGLSVSLGLAWLACRPIRGARLYRLLLIYPYALSPAIAGTLWLFLFNPEVGLVNTFLGATLGVKPRWLEDPTLAFALVVLASIWKGLGYNVVFYIAAISSLPKDVMEAAEIDGANAWQVFTRVAMPLLSSTTFFLVFTNVVSALFDSFGLVDILTSGGPYHGSTGATTFLMYQLYEDGFRNFNTGLAAAQAVLLLIMVGAITIMQFRAGAKRVHYGA